MRALPVIATMLGALAAGMATFAALYHHRRVRGAVSVGISALWIVSAAFVGAFAAFTATASVTQTIATPGTPVPAVPVPTATADTTAASITIDWADVDAKYRALLPLSGLAPAAIERGLEVVHRFEQVAAVSELTSLLAA